jgi:hypoxanthine phosphoribosyltransferase
MSDTNPSVSPTAKVLIQAEALHQRLQEVAAQISGDYAGREIDLVCLTNAAMTFTADLMRLLEVPVRLHALAFTSYSPVPVSGEVRLTLDIAEPLEGRHVLVVEGMVISGRTPLYLANLLRLRQPASLALCAIGSKPAELAVDLPIKYRLFEFGKEWVAGYGIGHGAEKASADLLDMSSTQSARA